MANHVHLLLRPGGCTGADLARTLTCAVLSVSPPNGHSRSATIQFRRRRIVERKEATEMRPAARGDFNSPTIRLPSTVLPRLHLSLLHDVVSHGTIPSKAVVC